MPSDAVNPCHAGAHGNEREHVQIAGANRGNAAHEKGPTRPKHDGRCEQQLQPIRRLLPKPMVQAGEVPAHFKSGDRQGENEPHPESSAHVRKLWIFALTSSDEFGLECHAANGAIAGTDLTDLRMHWAGIDGAFRNRWRRLRRTLNVLLGVGSKLFLAARRAEIIGAHPVLVTMLGSMGIDDHSTDKVFDARRACSALMPIVAVPAAKFICRHDRSPFPRYPTRVSLDVSTPRGYASSYGKTLERFMSQTPEPD